MQNLLEAVRKASLPGIWSQGVKLARSQVVSVASSTEAERTLRVRVPGVAIAPTVTLYVDGGEWSCDCDSRVDPCPHVVAAAIVSSQAPAQAAQPDESSAPALPTPARIVYELGLKDRLLTLTRVIVHGDGREEKLGAALTSTLARRSGPSDLVPTHEDLKIDRILGWPARDVLPVARLADLFDALAGGGQVTWEGKPVSVSAEPVLPRAIVEDAPGGFLLRLEMSPSVTRVVARGVALCGAVLRPLGESATVGEFGERLPLRRTFTKSDVAALVTNVLPELEAKLDVIVTTKKLPRTHEEAKPRIAMDLSHHGHTLSVLPTLVYGDPAVARVDGDDLVPLGKKVPVRRQAVERELLRRLRDELNLVPGRRVDLDGPEAIRFAAKLRGWQERAGDGGEGSKRTFDERPLVPRLVVDDERFDVVFEREEAPGDRQGDEGYDGPRRADAATVIRAWQDGLDLVPLDGGGWAPLPAGWLAQYGHRVADLFAARDEEGKLRRSALPELGALCEALEAPKPPGLDKLAPLLGDFEGVPRATLPPNVTASLRHYQEAGFDWLSFLRDAELGAVLADDMGLGKTLQTICALRGRTLVVCPKSVVYNWAEEITRFRPGLGAKIYHGEGRALDPSADVTLTTYAILRLDLARLAEPEWDAVVLDEAQAIKNLGSQTARAAFALKGKFRVALSGTPVENRLDELWSIMHFANPGLLGGPSDFQERYASPIGNGDKSAAARLRAKIRPFVLRRMKRDVLPELPPRTDAVLHVELDQTERSVYDAVRVATKKEVADKLAQGGGVLAALEALLRLRQASCHPALVPGQQAPSSSKVERLLEALSELASEGHKALVFSQWTTLLDLVEPHLTAAGHAFTRLDGQTRDREAVVREFQSEGGPPVMLVSLKAGGTGLNLTAADHVFLLDPWWNPAVEDQAADRAHRIGQERPVMVYRMVAKDTVEERIFALQAKKRALADVALGSADQAGGITREELLALLD